MNTIYFCDHKYDWERVYPADVRARIAAAFDVPPRLFGSADLGDVDFSGVKYIFSTWGMPSLSEQQIREFFPALECVFYAAGTVRYFAGPFLECGVRVFSGWQANAVPVVEYAIAQIVLAAKGFYPLLGMTKRDYAAAVQYRNRFKGNYDIDVGILGDGAIGGEVIRRIRRDYRVNVWVYSITMTPARADELGVRLCSLDEIFAGCDVISNHLADNAQTKNMISAARLKSMKPYTTFINTGRGAQVDEAALVEVLESDPTLTAVLDVTYPEPPKPDSKLYTLPNVFLTPHIAGSNGNEVRRMSEYMLEEAVRYLGGEPLKYEVTEAMLEHMA